MKAALITGGSRGIGRAIVEEFAAAGYAVAFTYSQNADAANSLVQHLRAEGRAVAAYQADARDFSRAKLEPRSIHASAPRQVLRFAGPPDRAA